MALTAESTERRRSLAATATAALNDATTNQLYALLVDNLPQSAVHLFDPHLRLLLAGGQARRPGKSRGRSERGRSLRDLVSASFWTVLEPAYQRALAGENVELEHLAADCSRRYRVRMSPVRSGGVVVAGLAVTDELPEQAEDGAAQERAAERWRQLFLSAPTGMWLSEPGADGRLLDVNDALCELLQLSREQILASSKNVLFQAPDSAALTPLYDAVRQGQQRSVERALLLPDGSTRHVTITATLLDDADGPRVLAHFTDITAIKEVEAQLRAASELHEAVLKVIPDPIHIADVHTGEHTWRTKNSDGLPPVHPDDRAILENSIRAVALVGDGEVINARHRAIAADGSLRWLDRRKTPFRRDASGNVELYVGITRDVTDEVAKEAELRDSSAFQEAVLASSPDIVTVFDIVSMQTLWASRSLLDVLGRSLETVRDMQQRGTDTLIHPDDVAAYRKAVQDSAELADGQVGVFELRALHNDRTWRAFEQRTTPFRRDDTGRVVQVLNVTRDVSMQRATSAELEQRRAFQEAVISTTPDVISLVDNATSRLVWASRPVDDLLGWSLAELQAIGDQPLESLVHAEDLAAFQQLERDARVAKTGDVLQTVYRAQHRDGTWRWISRRMTPFARAGSGEVTQSLAMVRDVTSVVNAQHQLEYVALHDPLTSLPNRRLVLERLQTALSTTGRGGHVAVLFVDLDGFKQINDAYGHAAGDAVLVATASRLQDAIRSVDTVGRMGGDEFVIVLERTDDSAVDELALSIAERLRQSIAEPIVFNGVSHQVSCSVGITTATNADDADDVLRNADSAMYSAKGAGKNRLAVFDGRTRSVSGVSTG